MKKHNPIFLLTTMLVMLMSAQRSYACHALPIVGLAVTSNSTQILVNGSSDPATCGCGPYYMEVEVSLSSTGFTGLAPASNSSLWNTYPWFRDSLSVPDNCTLEPYYPVEIPIANLCPGGTYYLRVRERTSLNSGPWSAPVSFVVPGNPPPPSAFIATVVPATAQLCGLTTSQLLSTSITGSCNTSAVFYSWAPPTGLSATVGPVVTASPTVTTTYTLTCFDPTLNYTTTAQTTITISPSPTVTLTSMIPASCSGFDGSITVNATGGTSPYTFNAFDILQNTNYTALTNTLPSGFYEVTVTDANNCIDTLQVTLDDSCDYVWPGDANDDGLADNFDILTIGVANGAIGLTRPSASLNWVGQPAPNWATSTPLGVNHKHVDCDGNSFVTLNDTAAVVLNYGYVHNNRLAAPVYNATVPDLLLKLVQDTLQPNTAGILQVRLGTTALPISGVYGVAFTINFDPQYIDAASLGLSLSGSMLGTPNFNIMGVKVVNAALGRLDVTVTRITQSNTSGQGLLCSIPFRTTSALMATGNTIATPLSLSRVRVINNQESPIAVNLLNDTLIAIDTMFTTGIQHAAGAITALSVMPNPNDGQFNLQVQTTTRSNYNVTIYNVNGQLIWTEQLLNFSGTTTRTLDLSTWGSGVYLVRLSNNETIETRRFIVR